MARRADVFLHPRPGTDLVWLSAITRYLLDNGLAHDDFLRQWVNGLEEYKKRLEPFTMEFASQTCGLPVETLEKVAHMIAEASGVCVLWENNSERAEDRTIDVGSQDVESSPKTRTPAIAREGVIVNVAASL